MEKIISSLVKFISQNSDDCDDNVQEILKYGFELLITKVFLIVVIMLIGAITNCFWECMIFTLFFSQIRSISGGYHANSRLSCFIISLLLVLISIIFLKIQIYYNFVFTGITVLSIASSVFLYIVTPIDTENKRLDKNETILFRKKARLTIVIEILFIAFFYLIGFKNESFIISLAIVETSILVLIELRKKTSDTVS